MPGSSPILLERGGGTLTVTLARPAARNAIDAGVLAGLEEACVEAERDLGLRSLVLRGAGGFFSAGGDLKERAALVAAGNREALIARSRREGLLLARIAALPQVVVAAVEGGAFGLGLGLAVAADITVAARPARFAAPEVTIGAVPAQIAPHLVGRIGMSEARRLLLTGTTVDADHALRVGLVQAVRDDKDALEVAVAALVAEIAATLPAATAATKRLLGRIMPPDAGYADAAAMAYVAAVMDRH